MSGESFGFMTGGGGVTGVWWVEAADAASHPTLYRSASSLQQRLSLSRVSNTAKETLARQFFVLEGCLVHRCLVGHTLAWGFYMLYCIRIPSSSNDNQNYLQILTNIP